MMRSTGFERYSGTPVAEQQNISPPSFAYLRDLFLDSSAIKQLLHAHKFPRKFIRPEAARFKRSLASRERFARSGGNIDLISTRLEVYKKMIERNPSKYEGWLCGMQFFRFLSPLTLRHSQMRADIMDCIYTAMRILDDVVDRDSPVIFSHEESAQYVSGRIAALRSGYSTGGFSDPVDAFLQKALDLARKLGIKIEERILQIMESIAFDAERISFFSDHGYFQIDPNSRLRDHFYKLDTDGTVGGSLLIFGEKDSEKNMQEALPLSEATRIYYTLRDFQDDIYAGFCNIPAEGMEEFSIAMSDLHELRELVHIAKDLQSFIQSEARRQGVPRENKKDFDNMLRELFEDDDFSARAAKIGVTLESIFRSGRIGVASAKIPSSIRNWMAQQVQEGNTLLSLHEQRKKRSEFKAFTKLATTVMYQKPAQRYFDRLSEELLAT